MIIQRTDSGIVIAAPAKINLFLEVLGKRRDGFHEVQTVMCPISLFDRLTFAFTGPSGHHANDIDFHLHLPQAERIGNDPAWDIPADDRNLVVRVVRRVLQVLGINQSCRIELQKTIPAAAGLGGGSSNAAAAIVASMFAANAWDRNLASQIASEIGSDVPFFLGGTDGIGLTLATGRGETCLLLPARPKLDLLVTHPPVGCSTREVYQNYVDYGEKRDFQKIVAACETGQSKKIGAQLFNSLQLPAATLTDWIDRQLRLFDTNGVLYALMSGSGSSCFALIEDPGCTERIRDAAPKIGLPRVYSTKAWYGDSIEQQLSRQCG